MEQQQTPQIQASNIVDKRWKPKNWIEFDTEFQIDPRTAGEEGSFAALEFKYYAGVNAKSKDGKTIVLSGTVTSPERSCTWRLARFGLYFTIDAEASSPERQWRQS